jgi:hypothetical protein
MPPVQGTDGAGSGVTLTTTFGVHGDSTTGVGVAGTSNSGDGVLGVSGKAIGVRGTGGRKAAAAPSGVVGVWGDSKNGPGVVGASDAAEGVRGVSADASGVTGRASAPSQAGVVGLHVGLTGFALGVVGATASSDPTAAGVGGIAPEGSGVLGVSIEGTGTRGIAAGASGLGPTEVAGVWGDSRRGFGVYGTSRDTVGVCGETASEGEFREGAGPGQKAGVAGIHRGGYGCGVFAHSDRWVGLWAEGRSAIIAQAYASPYNNTALEAMGFGDKTICVYGYDLVHAKSSFAGYFWGKVQVTGALIKTGGGFQIDHPADPAGKYLNHSFVESSERKNVYDGVAVLDRRGEATVRLPSWVEAVNRDFRYQLTPIGRPAPDLHVGRPLSRGRFGIAGGRRGLRVSWQLTGVRKDAWARANPIDVEERKTGVERGTYLHPTLHGQPESMNVDRARNPERAQRIDEMRQRAAATRRAAGGRPGRRRKARAR